MNQDFIKKMIQMCDDKITKKGNNVGISFYAFFQNKNTNPELLLSVATWWIYDNQLDHFEKAIKIKGLLINEKVHQ